MNLPTDDFLLLSLVNTKLRDCYEDFNSLCEEEDVDGEKITRRLAAIGYYYEKSANAFK